MLISLFEFQYRKIEYMTRYHNSIRNRSQLIGNILKRTDVKMILPVACLVPSIVNHVLAKTEENTDDRSLVAALISVSIFSEVTDE